MEIKQEDLGTQNISKEVTPQVIEVGKIEVAEDEFNDLKHRAEVSSQNFERAKKAELELKEFKELQDNQTLSVYDDEPVKKLEEKVSELNQKVAKAELIEKYPVLKDIWNDFETFQNEEDNRGMNLRTSAKAFLTEKGLLDPVRKGLEKPTGGSKEPFSSGMKVEEVKKLRETNFKKYSDMLKKGQIKFS